MQNSELNANCTNWCHGVPFPLVTFLLFCFPFTRVALPELLVLTFFLCSAFDSRSSQLAFLFWQNFEPSLFYKLISAAIIPSLPLSRLSFSFLPLLFLAFPRFFILVYSSFQFVSPFFFFVLFKMWPIEPSGLVHLFEFFFCFGSSIFLGIELSLMFVQIKYMS